MTQDLLKSIGLYVIRTSNEIVV